MTPRERLARKIARELIRASYGLYDQEAVDIIARHLCPSKDTERMTAALDVGGVWIHNGYHYVKCKNRRQIDAAMSQAKKARVRK